MVSSSQIRAALANFLANRTSLDAFEDWFVQNTWNIHRSGSVSAENLTFAIEESLSEYSSRHIDLQELRNELGHLIQYENEHVVSVVAPAGVPLIALKPLWRFASVPAIALTALV